MGPESAGCCGMLRDAACVRASEHLLVKGLPVLHGREGTSLMNLMTFKGWIMSLSDFETSAATESKY